MAFNMPAYCNVTMKPTPDNSSSAHSFQPKEVTDLNLKRMGMGREFSWRISRSGIEEAKRAQETFVSRWQMESHTRPRRWRQVITEHRQEMHVGIIPRINEGSAFTIWVATPFFLLGAFQLREVSIFTCGFGGRIIDDNLFLLTTRRTLAFRLCHDGIFDQNRVVRMFWGRRHDEGKGNEKVVYANDGKGKNQPSKEASY